MPINVDDVKWDETPQIKTEEVQWEESPPQDGLTTEQLPPQAGATTEQPAQWPEDPIFGTINKILPEGSKLKSYNTYVADTLRSAGLPEVAITEITENLPKETGVALRSIPAGVASAVGMVTDPVSWAVNKVLPEDMQISSSEDTMEYILSKAGVPEPKGKAQKFRYELGKAMSAAGTFSGTAAMAERGLTGVKKMVAGTLAASPEAQIVGAGTGQLAEETAEEMGAGPKTQLAANIAGSIAGGGLTSLKDIQAPLPKAVQEAQRKNIKVMTSDVIKPESGFWKWIQGATERLPGGTGGTRAKQFRQQVDAVVNELKEYGIKKNDPYVESVTKDLMDTNAKFVSKWKGFKTDVLKSVNDKGTLPMEKTISQIDQEIAELQKLSPTKTKPLVDELTTLKDDLANKTALEIEQNRSLFGETLGTDAFAGLRTNANKVKRRIYKAINEDIGDFISDNAEDPKALTKWKVANNQLHKNIKTIEKTALKNILNKGTEDLSAARTLLFSREPTHNRLLYNKLSKKGRVNARKAIVSEVIDKAGGIENISPQKFANEIGRVSKKIGVYFTKAQVDELKGLKMAIDYTRRAAESKAMPPTGLQAAPGVNLIAAGHAVGNFLGGLVVAWNAGMATRMIESAPVRDILYKFSKATSEQRKAILFKQLYNAVRSEQNKENP